MTRGEISRLAVFRFHKTMGGKHDRTGHTSTHLAYTSSELLEDYDSRDGLACGTAPRSRWDEMVVARRCDNIFARLARSHRSSRDDQGGAGALKACELRREGTLALGHREGHPPSQLPSCSAGQPPTDGPVNLRLKSVPNCSAERALPHHLPARTLFLGKGS